jgi:hypothetical protein
MKFKVVNRDIFYTDRKWEGNMIRCIPKDENFIRKVIMSRNKLPKVLIDMFNLSKEEKAEYESAKTEKELADNIVRDCKRKGAILVSREEGENDNN